MAAILKSVTWRNRVAFNGGWQRKGIWCPLTLGQAYSPSSPYSGQTSSETSVQFSTLPGMSCADFLNFPWFLQKWLFLCLRSHFTAKSPSLFNLSRVKNENSMQEIPGRVILQVTSDLFYIFRATVQGCSHGRHRTNTEQKDFCLAELPVPTFKGLAFWKAWPDAIEVHSNGRHFEKHDLTQ
jgi:hypothetical protein